ncbi:MAG: transglutaminase family protein [Pirellulaceae bacterium]
MATLNLLCAQGLPHSEDIDLDRIGEWLDKAARQVELVTARHWYRFLKSPEFYHNSPAYFRCYYMLQVLQEDFGVKYNPKRAVDSDFQNANCMNPDFRDSRDLFIHGIIDGEGGTCCSMPILYAAVGRRLGYPLEIVEAPGHYFNRWNDRDGSKFGTAEVINIEGSGYGITTHPDEYYRTWPKPWSDKDKAADCYLKSLSPEQELAGFLATRAECLTDCGRTTEAVQAYVWAISLSPTDIRYRSQLGKLTYRIGDDAQDRKRLEDIKKRQRELLSPKPNKPKSPPHGDICQCVVCVEARKAMTPAGFPGHWSGCPCLSCKQARETKPVSAFAGHPPGCPCFNCQEARQPKQSTPGHPPGCFCVQCRPIFPFRR